jgi:hypothetical protein
MIPNANYLAVKTAIDAGPDTSVLPNYTNPEMLVMFNAMFLGEWWIVPELDEYGWLVLDLSAQQLDFENAFMLISAFASSGAQYDHFSNWKELTDKDSRKKGEIVY